MLISPLRSQLKSFVQVSLASACIFAATMSTASSTPATTFYELSAVDNKKNLISFSDFKEKVVLVVNVASKCGFTPQYEGLEKIYQQFKDRGFTILGFPCNQFGSQEPGNEEEIMSFCKLNYGVSFPIMSKIDVNGDQEHAVYRWLKDQKAGLLGIQRIKWNFEKFLISKDGHVVNRFSSITKPEDLVSEIEKALSHRSEL